MRLVSCDVDDVLYHFVPSLFDWHNKAYPQFKISHKDLRHYDFREYAHALGNCRAEKSKKVHEFYGAREFRDIPLVEGAVRGIQELSSRYRLMSVTSRPPSTKVATLEAFGRDFKDKFERVVFIDSFEKQTRSKGEVCREHGAVVHIDDLIPHLEDCANHGVGGILLDRSWNQGNVPKNVIRVYHWDEIPSAVEFIRNRYAA